MRLGGHLCVEYTGSRWASMWRLSCSSCPHGWKCTILGIARSVRSPFPAHRWKTSTPRHLATFTHKPLLRSTACIVRLYTHDQQSPSYDLRRPVCLSIVLYTSFIPRNRGRPAPKQGSGDNSDPRNEWTRKNNTRAARQRISADIQHPSSTTPTLI
jgi:hypothetical protein